MDRQKGLEVNIGEADEGLLVYKTNREVYATTEKVDLLFSIATMYSFYKVFSKSYAATIAFKTGLSPLMPLMYTGVFSITSWIGIKYLMTTYLS